MTKDSLIALLINYLRDNISFLGKEDRFLIHILYRYLITLILPDRNQNISEQLPEIISNAVRSFITAKDSDAIKLRTEYEKILGRKISDEEDNAKIFSLVKKIMEPESLKK